MAAKLLSDMIDWRGDVLGIAKMGGVSFVYGLRLQQGVTCGFRVTQ